MKGYYERYWKKQEELGDFKYKWPVLKKLIPTKKSIKILDFGCGKGVMSKEIIKINPSASFVGVDVSSEAIRFIKKEIPNGKFYIIKDGGKLPFNDTTFDFIIASDVLEHVYDTENAFTELSRVLKKNGQILISVPYNGIIKRTIIALFFFDSIFEPTTPHIRQYTKNNLQKHLYKNGITSSRVGYYGRIFPLSSGMFIIGKKVIN